MDNLWHVDFGISMYNFLANANLVGFVFDCAQILVLTCFWERFFHYPDFLPSCVI